MSELHDYLKSQESLITSSIEGKTLIDFIDRIFLDIYDTKLFAETIGPTVCELDGPIPILKMSKILNELVIFIIE